MSLLHTLVTDGMDLAYSELSLLQRLPMRRRQRLGEIQEVDGDGRTSACAELMLDWDALLPGRCR